MLAWLARRIVRDVRYQLRPDRVPRRRVVGHGCSSSTRLDADGRLLTIARSRLGPRHRFAEPARGEPAGASSAAAGRRLRGLHVSRWRQPIAWASALVGPVRRVARSARIGPVDLVRRRRASPSNGATSQSPASGASRRSAVLAAGHASGDPSCAWQVSSGSARPWYTPTTTFRREVDGRSARLGVPRRRRSAARRRTHRPPERTRRPEPLLVRRGAVASIGLGVAGLEQLVGGPQAENLALLALATLYGLIAALVFTRERDLSTFLWAPALVVAGAASWQLLDGTWLVLAWSTASAPLIALARWTGEKRLELASFSFLSLALGASPRHTRRRWATSSIPTPIRSRASQLLLRSPPQPSSRSSSAKRPATRRRARARTRRSPTPSTRKRSLWRNDRRSRSGDSLHVCDLADHPRSRRGRSGTEASRPTSSAAIRPSAPSGACSGSRSSTSGSSAGINWLRFVGFGLFGLALAKLFLYDLAFLSSITRALSFLAVGALLLIAGFFVQKLSEESAVRPLLRRGALPA